MSHRTSRVFATAACLALICLLCGPTPAEAYIDPGTGSIAYQLILAAALGAVFFIRRLRARVYSLVRRMSGRSESPPPQEPE